MTDNKLLARLQVARQHLDNGRRDEAAAIYDEVSATAGESADLQSQLGQLCTLFGAHDKAVQHFTRALRQTPEDPACLGYLGLARLHCGDTDEAFALLRKANDKQPDLPHVLYGLGMLHRERAEYPEAKACMEKALGFQPRDVLTLTSLAQTLTFLDEYEEAMKLARRALKIDASDASALVVLGNILTETGDSEEAIRHYEKMIRNKCQVGLAYGNLVRLKKASADDRSLIRKAEKSLSQGMAPRDRIGVHFALGKLYDDCGEYDKAFSHFHNANLLEKVPHKPGVDRKRFKLQRKIFTRKTISEYAQHGHSSDQPVFIVGMPRSGTTLMERIIASHSWGTGAGELPVIRQIAHRLIGDQESATVAAARQRLNSDALHEQAEHYLSVLRRNREGSQRIVDKMPGNYMYLGLISALFPNASIIHAVRNPLDTCLSCYFQAFGQVGWANDLKTIAEVYKLYRAYMDYWANELPAGKIHDVSYEKLTAEPVAEAQKMIAHCGLPWEAESLEFHSQRAVVKTLSQWQVRQPIYQSANRRWLHYKDHIGELVEELAGYLEDDKALLAEHGIKLRIRRRFGWPG